MEHEISFDFKNVADAVRLPVDRVKATVALLDEGNAIPFITRFRKDQTGGLNESQIRNLKSEVALQRGLIERKQAIIKTIDSQQKLTDELLSEIKAAASHKSLEDIYLPYRPKRQTLAATARQQGLEPLAAELLEKRESESDLASRALEYVRVDRGISTVDQVYEGVGHLVAEHFGDHVELRKQLRDLLWKSGKLASRKIESDSDADKKNPPAKEAAETVANQNTEKKTEQQLPPQSNAVTSPADQVSTSPQPADDAEAISADGNQQPASADAAESAQPEDTPPENTPPENTQPVSESKDAGDSQMTTASAEETSTSAPTAQPSVESAEKPAAGLEKKSKKKKKKKKKSGNKPEDIFKDFFNFSAPIRSLPPHRILAINRGERAKTLRVRVEADNAEVQKIAREALVDPDHPQIDFMHRCVDDALNRLILPGLEREIRRELTEAAEKHALKVFAKNLRNLLLQPPLRKHRVLAVDPGYQSGCRYAALDEFGHPLATGVVHVVGNAERRRGEESALATIIREHKITAIGIGNGAASRETEKMIARLLQNELKDVSVAYAMINEAGASAYSTSVIGREELPDYDAAFRSAISIGRRMLDPLSELVKISPENLGIGMYQHDVKAKHLQEQLADVVESCVNFVGVDVNTASPALLKYVAGLNQLTARRVFEYRQESGPFLNREQFKLIPGFGDVTFLQSAGFLKIFDGDQPLDATPIHPESYEVARQILQRVEIDPGELVSTSKALMKNRVPLVSHEKRSDEKTDANANAIVASEQAPTDTATQATATQDTATQDTATQDTATQETATQETATQETATQETATQETATQETPTQETATQETPTQDTATQDVAAADIAAAESATRSNDVESSVADAPTESETPTSPGDATAVSESVEPTKTDNAQGAAPPDAPETTPEKPAEEPVAQNSKPVEQEQPIRDNEKLEQMSRWREKIRAIDSDKLAADMNIGGLTLRDILSTITRPTRDPRESLPKPIFRREIVKVEDLDAGMQIRGRVVNVVDFGVFVDIGLGESSLVHVSQLSRRFVNDPHEVAVIGDLMKLWVTQIDKPRRRITLTAINPAPKPPRKKPERESNRKPRPVAKKRSRVDANRGGNSGGRPKHTRPHKPPKPPKPVKPITDAMKKGAEPMRSFSDLQQFYKSDPKKDDKE